MLEERRCWIFPDMKCYVDDDEVPLEVCRLCVEARMKRVTVRRRGMQS
jgi:hypothetical protein